MPMMNLLIKTNKNKVEVFNADTKEQLTNIGRVDIYITSSGRASASVTFKNIELDMEIEKWIESK